MYQTEGKNIFHLKIIFKIFIQFLKWRKRLPLLGTCVKFLMYKIHVWIYWYIVQCTYNTNIYVYTNNVIYNLCKYVFRGYRIWYIEALVGAEIGKRSLSWLQTCALTSKWVKKNVFFIYVSRGHTDVIWKSPGKAKAHEHWTWTTVMPVQNRYITQIKGKKK